MKKLLVVSMLLVVMLLVVGCKNKFETSLNANEDYASSWSAKGEVARFLGYSQIEQAHYVVFAKKDVPSSFIYEGTEKGHTVYSYNKHVSIIIYNKYKGGE